MSKSKVTPRTQEKKKAKGPSTRDTGMMGKKTYFGLQQRTLSRLWFISSVRIEMQMCLNWSVVARRESLLR
jgi:hypothetical protein